MHVVAGSSKPLRLVKAGGKPARDDDGELEVLSLDEVYRRNAQYVAAIGYRLLGRNHEVDDLVQDVFVEAARGLSSLRRSGAVRGWLATIAVRQVGRRLRARKIRRMVGIERDPLEPHDVASRAVSPHDQTMLTRVYAVLEEIPVKERLAWTLRHVEGEKLERVAVLCGCSLATAKRRIAAAHEKITEALADG